MFCKRSSSVQNTGCAEGCPPRGRSRERYRGWEQSRWKCHRVHYFHASWLTCVPHLFFGMNQMLRCKNAENSHSLPGLFISTSASITSLWFNQTHCKLFINLNYVACERNHHHGNDTKSTPYGDLLTEHPLTHNLQASQSFREVASFFTDKTPEARRGPVSC